MITLKYAFTLSLILPAAAWAERIDIPAPLSSVIVYPDGASMTRDISFTAPAGQHQIVIPGLPAEIDPSSIRIEAKDVTIGSVEVQSARNLPDHSPESPAITDARASLRQAKDALREFDRNIQALNTRADVLRQRAQMTRELLLGDSRLPVDEIPETVQQMGALIEDLLTQSDDLNHQIAMSEPDRQPLLDAIDRATAELLAVQDANADSETMVMTVQTTDQPAQITITSFTEGAGWNPDYELRLDREAGSLTMQRGVSVWQASGEDWSDVALTLSTARPRMQSAPTEVPSWMPSYGRADADRVQMRARKMEDESFAEMAAAAPADIGGAEMSRLGLTVVYTYNGPVTIRDNADSLRLTLDEKPLTPEILAEAAPRFDDSAYLVAETRNDTGEPILPGQVTLYADGALVGQSYTSMVADGDKMRFGFGPIDGLRTEFRLPQEEQGDTGFIRRSNRLTETATLTVENLTSEEWPLRVVDRIPVSRQEDLTVDWSADPKPTETDPDGRRGILYWQAPIAPGETREITLNTELLWPDGNDLLR